jgi:hypothetical protein
MQEQRTGYKAQGGTFTYGGAVGSGGAAHEQPDVRLIAQVPHAQQKGGVRRQTPHLRR